MMKFFRSSKTKSTHPRYKITRDFTKIDWPSINTSLLNDLEMKRAAIIDDSDEVSEIIIERINKHLEDQQPIRKIQITDKPRNFISDDTKSLLKRKDDALARAKTTNDEDDFREYRHLRNQSHREITKDKNEAQKKAFKKAETDPKQQWGEAKESLGWNKSESPQVLKLEYFETFLSANILFF